MDGINATVRGTQWLNQKQKEKLAEEKGNVVYDYTFDKPERIMPSKEVHQLVTEIRTKYLDYKQKHPDWDDEKIRHYICCEKYKYKSFAKSHSLQFKNATDKDTDADKMRYQFYMIDLQRQYEEGIITFEQSKAMIHKYMLDESMKKSKPVPKRNAK